jgi:hypothetical protein
VKFTADQARPSPVNFTEFPRFLMPANTPGTTSSGLPSAADKVAATFVISL